MGVKRVESSVGVRYMAYFRAPSGRQRQKTFTKKVDAVRWERDSIQARDAGEWIDPRCARTNFDEYAAGWLAMKRIAVSPRTFVNIEGRLRNHIAPFFGRSAIGSIKPADVREWAAHLIEDDMAPDTAQGPSGLRTDFPAGGDRPTDLSQPDRRNRAPAFANAEGDALPEAD
jgi:Phage integrase, N-terminal SAM-like domain